MKLPYNLCRIGLLFLLAQPRAAQALPWLIVGKTGNQPKTKVGQVVIVRQDKNTVVTLQPSYEGANAEFALLIPVPSTVDPTQLKKIEPSLIDRMELLTAPRLTEMWEHDPCDPALKNAVDPPIGTTQIPEALTPHILPRQANEAVTGEYIFSTLPPAESATIAPWLKSRNYDVTEQTQTSLQEYTSGTWTWVIAEVDPKKVPLREGFTELPPIQMTFQSETMVLPIRVGLSNANEMQDLLVYVLAPSTRYEVSNRTNIPVASNVQASGRTKLRFPVFYNAFFKSTQEGHMDAVVLEYAFPAGLCDSCTTSPLTSAELQSFGAQGNATAPISPTDPQAFILTRLHKRYAPQFAGADLAFQPTGPIVGGVGRPQVMGLKTSPKTPTENRFQSRFSFLNPWNGPIECSDPIRDHWEGPAAAPANIKMMDVATNLGLLPAKDLDLASFVRNKQLVDSDDKRRSRGAGRGTVPRKSQVSFVEKLRRHHYLVGGTLFGSGFVLLIWLVRSTKKREDEQES